MKNNRQNICLSYYPFGTVMLGRSFSPKDYRFGFNGKEDDTETCTQDYGLRIYNPALGKFLSVDPMTHEFAWNSTYAFAENDVIRAIDLEGAEKGIIIYSPHLADKVKCALESKNYKEVMRIYTYASTHNWVDANGNKSDYYKRLYRKLSGNKNQIDIPDNSATMDWQDKDQFNVGMVEKYGKQANGKGWLRVESFNIETGKYESLGIIPIVKIKDDGIIKSYDVKDIQKVEPIFTNKEKEEMTQLKIDAIGDVIKLGHPKQPPTGVSSIVDINIEINNIKMQGVLRKLGSGSQIIESYEDDYGINYKIKHTYTIDDNGKENFSHTGGRKTFSNTRKTTQTNEG